MLTLSISITLVLILSTVYITAQRNHNLQADLITVENNIRLAQHILRFNLKQNITGTEHSISNATENYYIRKTQRKNRYGEPIFGLYKKTEHHHSMLLIEGVDALDVHYDVENNVIRGISIRLTFHTNKLHKFSYLYLHIQAAN